MEFIIITGMSGSGKSRAVAAMEDIGYYCIDNLPPKMVKAFTELCLQAENRLEKVAIVVDARSREVFGDIFEGIREFLHAGSGFQILFLDCDDEVLIQRYKETRRKHPLMDDQLTSIEEAILHERTMLSAIRDCANYIVDTTYLSNHQLREKLLGVFLADQKQSMLVNCISFGFKFGIPKEADLVFDVRCLPNPFYLPALKNKTGLDHEVSEYVLQWEEARRLREKLFDLIDFSLPLYRQEGKTQLTVAIGCTGGKHRSVTFAEEIGRHMQEQQVRCAIGHRDIAKHKE